MERIGFNATMNSGALKWNGKYLMVVRVEGADRKSFFAIAESPNGVDNFHFWKRPLVLPDVDPAENNVYDMRLTAHPMCIRDRFSIKICSLFCFRFHISCYLCYTRSDLM